MRGLPSHLVTSFAGAAIDNLFRGLVGVALAIIAVERHGAADGYRIGLEYGMLASLAFIVPFVLFAPLAGNLGDRLPKHRVIRAVRLLDLPIILVGVVGLALNNVQLLCVALGLLGIASTFFSPVKYAIVPELVSAQRYDVANAWLQTVSVVAILAGGALIAVADPDVLAGLGLSKTVVVTLIAGSIAAGGLFAAWRIPAVPAQAPATPLRPFAFTEQFRALGSAPGVAAPALGLAGFWGLGAAISVMLAMLALQGWGLKEAGAAAAGLALAFGMIAGAVLSVKMQARAFPAGLPLFGCGIAGVALIAAGLIAERAVPGGNAWADARWWDVPRPDVRHRRRRWLVGNPAPDADPRARAGRGAQPRHGRRRHRRQRRDGGRVRWLLAAVGHHRHGGATAGDAARQRRLGVRRRRPLPLPHPGRRFPALSADAQASGRCGCRAWNTCRRPAAAWWCATTSASPMA